jgi:hypothetical protein
MAAAIPAGGRSPGGFLPAQLPCPAGSPTTAAGLDGYPPSCRSPNMAHHCHQHPSSNARKWAPSSSTAVGHGSCSSSSFLHWRSWWCGCSPKSGITGSLPRSSCIEFVYSSSPKLLQLLTGSFLTVLVQHHFQRVISQIVAVFEGSAVQIRLGSKRQHPQCVIHHVQRTVGQKCDLTSSHVVPGPQTASEMSTM